ncbi:MAG TPA: CheR family methyltransferase [Kofleriaceae bacterium]|nr:CheR family methyltransferase [Kofleriaceae bacterium]
MRNLEPGLIQRVGDCIDACAGLRPPAWVLEARLVRRIDALGLDRPELYAELIESPDGGRELELLIESLRVGETRFFRHRAHVQAMTEVVMPALLRARASGPVRAWSAGCATGEEPYTLAVLLARGLTAPAYQVSVLATDISREALAVARAGVYPAAALEQVPADLLRAFEPAGDGRVRVAGGCADLVKFTHHNLAEGEYPRQMDLIWCRNVLIYFSPDARRQVVLRLIASLAPGGFLFVGYAESLRDFDALEAVRTPDAVLYRRPLLGAPGAQLRAHSEAGARRAPSAPLEPSGESRPRARARTDSSMPPERPKRWSPSRSSGARPFDALQVEEAVIELRGRYDDGARLARELGAVLSGSYGRVIIDLDGAAYLDEAAGQVLRRACSAARAAGVEVSLVAERQSTRRWLSRSGALAGEGE